MEDERKEEEEEGEEDGRREGWVCQRPKPLPDPSLPRAAVDTDTRILAVTWTLTANRTLAVTWILTVHQILTATQILAVTRISVLVTFQF